MGRARLLLTATLVRVELLLKWLQQKASAILGNSVLILSKQKGLEDLTKQFYNRTNSIECWGGGEVPTRGLSEEETHFVNTCLKGKKRCLVLMCGGGRESLALARLGFEVTGIDSSQTLIERARHYAAALSLNCTFEVGDVLAGPLSTETYDALFLTQTMYSEIPTRKRRIRFLERMRTLLKDGGRFYLEFRGIDSPRSGWKFRAKRRLARLVGGNLELEEGDTFAMGHFCHVFLDAAELLNEIDSAGFGVAELDFKKGYAVLTPEEP